MITGLVVLKMVLMPSRAGFAILANSGPRWSMTGRSMARRIRSGTGDGPGICRKWRPVGGKSSVSMQTILGDEAPHFCIQNAVVKRCPSGLTFYRGLTCIQNTPHEGRRDLHSARGMEITSAVMRSILYAS